jgi:hypothetical protein
MRFFENDFFRKGLSKERFWKNNPQDIEMDFQRLTRKKKSLLQSTTSRLKVMRKTAVNALGYGFPIFGKLNKKTNKSSFFM